MTDENPDSYSVAVNRERMLFVRLESDVSWSEKQMDNLVKSIDSATPEDVGVVLSTDDIDYLTRDEINKMVTRITESIIQESGDYCDAGYGESY